MNTSPHINIVGDGEIIDVNDPDVIAVLEKRLGRKVLFVNAYVSKD